MKYVVVTLKGTRGGVKTMLRMGDVVDVSLFEDDRFIKMFNVRIIDRTSIAAYALTKTARP